MKTEISLSKANRMINSGEVILVSSAYKDKYNIITLAWNTPLSHKPPLLGISIAKTHLSREFIENSEEFIVNIPSVELLDKTVYCGKHSGRQVDKFKETKIETEKAKFVKSPLIKQATINLECTLEKEVDSGDHIIFVGKILKSYINKDKKILFNMKKVEGKRIFQEL